MMRSRVWIGGFGLAVVSAAIVSMSACSSDPTPPSTGTGGATTGQGGVTGQGGSVTPGQGGSVTPGQGGSTVTGQGGAGTAGAGAGAPGAGAANACSMLTGSPFACKGTVADCSVITDIQPGSMEAWGGTNFKGGVFAYGGLTRDETKTDVLHITGDAAAYAGFGLWFTACSDLSAFKGIEFKLYGKSTGSPVTFTPQINSDAPCNDGSTGQNKGACPNATVASAYSDCAQPTKSVMTIGADAAAAPVTVLWADVAGGKPTVWTAAAGPKEVNGIQWQVAGATAIAGVDLYVDDIKLIPNDTATAAVPCTLAPATGGAGGGGGATATGGAAATGGGGGATAAGGAAATGGGSATGGATTGGGSATGGASTGGGGGAAPTGGATTGGGGGTGGTAP